MLVFLKVPGFMNYSQGEGKDHMGSNSLTLKPQNLLNNFKNYLKIKISHT